MADTGGDDRLPVEEPGDVMTSEDNTPNCYSDHAVETSSLPSLDYTQALEKHVGYSNEDKLSDKSEAYEGGIDEDIDDALDEGYMGMECTLERGYSLNESAIARDIRLENYDEVAVKYRRNLLFSRYNPSLRHLIPYRKSQRVRTEMPVDKSGLCSFITLSWITQLMWKAYKEGLKEEDLPLCSKYDMCGYNTDRLEILWNEEVKRRGKDKASIQHVMWRFYRTRLFVGMFFFAVTMLLGFLGPIIFMRFLLTWLSSDEPISVGIFWATGLIVSEFVRILLFGLVWTINYRTGIRLQAAYLGLLYKKLMRMSSLGKRSVGEIINLFSNDSQRIFDFIVIGPMIIGGPMVAVGGVIYILWLLGPWALFGMVTFLLFYPFQYCISRLMGYLRCQTVRVTDERVRMMNELLASVKFIKMYAWEKSFASTISEIEMDVCPICEKICTTYCVQVGPKGRRSLVAASVERQDGLHQDLETQEPLKVHIACRKAYTRESSIKSQKRKSEEPPAEPEVEPPTLRSQTLLFDITTHCLFCSEPLATSSRLTTKRQKSVSNVETLPFRQKLLDRARERNDEWGEIVAKRLIEVSSDLVAAEAKYHRNCAQEFLSNSATQKSVGKPPDAQRQAAFNELCAFLDENDECQYAVSDLMKLMETYMNGEEGYSLQYFKQKLKERYQEDIIITSLPGKSSIVSFRDSAHRILRENWMADRAADKAGENERIIEMAASIIRDDIRTSVFDLSEYPTLDDTENGLSMIPGSLNLFLHKLLDPKGKNAGVVSRRCITIAHSIISACRPRSFVSPVLLAIAVYIHRRYASRELIDILSSVSFSDDYKEVQRFESGLISTGEPSYGLSGFTQFVFDNADFNVATLTGHNTFHAMGGIACVTPPGTVEKSPVKRTMHPLTAEVVGTFGQIPIKTYSKPPVPGLQSVIVAPLQISDSQRVQVSSLDFVWMLGYMLNVTPCLPWTGFMKTVLNSDEFQTSRIETLPFINLDPSNLSTVYTALCFAQTQSEKHNLSICPVTFDQPLYQKASEIVAASKDLDKVVVRLGGFHLLMSYLGSIGHIMTGSGLAELWERVYAKGTVAHMLTGHAFSRAVRAHILTLLALICVLLEKSNWESQTNKDHLVNLYQDVVDQDESAAEIDEDETLQEFQQFLTLHLEEAATQSRTGKLWVQYIHQVLLMLSFINAERTGNWKLHLHCVQEMIPHFHAAGHLPYAKSARLYLQQMNSIEDVMPPEEYTLFSDKGYFTIRRASEFWSGNFSDQTIEQYLMRMLKTSGGMTHGRGITDSTLTKWVHALPHCVPVCDALEKFTGVHSATSEQHKDLRSSTQCKDRKDYDVFVQWLQVHPPFAGYQPDQLVSLATGIVADATVNCDNAVQIGQAAASALTGKQFSQITLHRCDKVKTMGDRNRVNVRGQYTVVNPTVFFNRITCVLKSSSDMEQYMSYELAPQPPSLFHDGAMRKPTKSALGTLLKSFAPTQHTLPNNCHFVVDGGHLLQSVVWPQQSTYGGVCQGYIAYILKHYGVGTTTVFDGYNTISTKAAEQLRRAKKTTSSDILFDQTMHTSTTQAAFLANSNNKRSLIEMLSSMLNQSGIAVKQASADADALIVSTALSLAESGEPVVVVGTDTDLLVMLVAQATTDMDLYMLCSKNPTTLYRVHEIQESLGETSQHLMVLHAITGCDTVSTVYRHGKRKAFNLVHNKKQYDQLKTFTNAYSTHQQVQEAGESFLLKLYGAPDCASLDEFRYIAYKMAVTRTSLSSSFQLASLPPTSAAAKQHSFRTYLTVQEWMGRPLQPTAWGWKLDGILTPVETDRPIAPDTLLNMIFCGCKADGCGASCGCRKMGVHCSALCTKCSGQTCNNVAPMSSFLEDEEDTEAQVSPETDDEDDA